MSKKFNKGKCRSSGHTFLATGEEERVAECVGVLVRGRHFHWLAGVSSIDAEAVVSRRLAVLADEHSGNVTLDAIVVATWMLTLAHPSEEHLDDRLVGLASCLSCSFLLLVDLMHPLVEGHERVDLCAVWFHPEDSRETGKDLSTRNMSS